MKSTSVSPMAIMLVLPMLSCAMLVAEPHAQQLRHGTSALLRTGAAGNATASLKEHADPLGGEPWTSTGPDSTDYNKETHTDFLPASVEAMFASLFILLIASVPLLLAALAEQELGRAHLIESLALIVWLGGTLFLFTSVLKFQSAHFDGTRCLTIVEAVYVLAQILTTVGYGDITPAFPRGQVWVGLNVIVALCLYGSMISEVIGIIQMRVERAVKGAEVSQDAHTPLKNWGQDHVGRANALKKSMAFFTVVATIGVFFWHFYPGENKTWLQAIYMSIITLSTVGFGAFTATTEAGKVFGAFWMMVGVAGLGALVSSFIELMMKEKQFERYSEKDDWKTFQDALDACLQNGKMDKATFLQCGLMITKGLDKESFDRIEARFDHLAGPADKKKERLVHRGKILDEEGPLR